MHARELQPDFAVTAICTLPPGLGADAVTSSGHVVALWPQDDGTLRWVWDGVAGEPFDAICEMRDKTPSVFASADGGHIAYMATRGDRHFVGRDGGEGAAYDGLTRSVPPVFSRDGRRLAYGAGNGDRIRLILDGSAVGDEQLAPIAAVFSPDGTRLAYAEMRGESRKDAELRIVLDGVPGDWFAGMRNAGGVMQFSPDSRRFAYCRIDGDLHTGWVIDGVPQRMDQEVPKLNLARLRGIGVLEPPLAATFSPDSRRFAYFADVPEKGVAIVEDNAPGPIVKAIIPPVFSPDSQHLAYLVQLFDGRIALVMDGATGPAWPAKEGWGPWFSPDGRHHVFVLRRQEGGFLRKRSLYALVVDGRVVAELPVGDIGAPVFSPDGERVACWVEHDKVRRMVLDGQIRAGDARVESDPVFTSAGRLAHVARPEPGTKITVTVDGRPGPLADDVAGDRSVLALFGRDLAPRFDVPFAVSPDGEHVAWLGLFEGAWHPVLDDRVGPAFEQPLWSTFEADGRATWYAQRGDAAFRVTAVP